MNNEQTTSRYKRTNPSEQMKLKDAFTLVCPQWNEMEQTEGVQKGAGY